MPLEQKVLSENDRIASELRERFRELGILCVNIISSPGSGKTSLLERTLDSLPRHERVAVLTGDIQTENDANRLKRFGFPVKQITTGGTCHLDARMIERHLADWNLEGLEHFVHRECGKPGVPVELRPGRGGENRAAQRDRGRGQAAQVSIDLL